MLWAADGRKPQSAKLGSIQRLTELKVREAPRDLAVGAQ